MKIDLNLLDLHLPHLSEVLLRRPLATLREISRKNQERFQQGGDTTQFKNRKGELIRRLKHRVMTGEGLEKVTDVVGRERLLLSLYLEYLDLSDAKNWLPSFDNTIAKSVLGDSGTHWHAARRRQAAQLFFIHFDRLNALPYLCARLVEAYSVPGQSGVAGTWHEFRKHLFDPAGPENIIAQSKGSENFSQFMERYAILNKGRFAEKLRQLYLLKGIILAPFGKETPVFTEVEQSRGDAVSEKMLMGAAALEIMVQRVSKEGNRKWPGDWPRWITRFGSDPRYGRASAEGAKWWGWATDTELRLAQQGITGLTLQFYIKFLRNSLSGTEKENQFSLRSRFLLALFEAGKIQNARLVLNRETLQKLESKYRDLGTVARLSGATSYMSMICLSCQNEVFILEGTHSFGLRMFHQEFPIDGFWDQPKKTYLDRDLRISPSDCPVFLRHDHSGKWVNKFFYELRSKFHIEWNDVEI